MSPPRRLRRFHALGSGVIATGLVAYAALVYVVVVVLVDRLTPISGTTRLALTLLAVTLVTLTTSVVRDRLTRWVPASAQSRLARVTSAPPDPTDLGARLDELTRLVSQIFGDQARAHITASLGGELTANWQWPREATPGSEQSLTVVQRSISRPGRELGELTLRLPPSRPLTPIEERLLQDAADYAALLLETARMDRTLQRVVGQSAERHRALQESRSRILTTMDEERRRVERDIHDGAQQHLVALVVNLRLLRVLLDRDPERARVSARGLQTAVLNAIQTLNRLSSGLYPSLLVEQGPVRALQVVADSSPIPVVVQADPGLRWTPVIERTAYFSCLEALQNAIKHAAARRIVVSVTKVGDGLAFEVSDDGSGFDPAVAAAGSGSANLRDRISTVGGQLAVWSAPGHGTAVSGFIPATADATGSAG